MMKRFLLLLVALLVVLAGIWPYHGGRALLAWQQLNSPPVRPQATNLWHIRAEYTYKGAPLILEFPMACESVWGHKRIHPNSHDVFSGPELYGVKTPDGKAVVMSTRGFCEVPYRLGPRFLPITVVYDDPETLAFGIMYASDEAYENKMAVLSLPKFTINRINQDDFFALSKLIPQNVVRMLRTNGLARELEFSGADKTQKAREPGKKPLVASSCHGWRRIKLSEKGRELVRAEWPKDRPAYWTLADGLSRFRLLQAIRDTNEDDKWLTTSGLASQNRGSGLKRHVTNIGDSILLFTNSPKIRCLHYLKALQPRRFTSSSAL
jgi:hypothetical protein